MRRDQLASFSPTNNVGSTPLSTMPNGASGANECPDLAGSGHAPLARDVIFTHVALRPSPFVFARGSRTTVLGAKGNECGFGVNSQAARECKR